MDKGSTVYILCCFSKMTKIDWYFLDMQSWKKIIIHNWNQEYSCYHKLRQKVEVEMEEVWKEEVEKTLVEAKVDIIVEVNFQVIFFISRKWE